MLGRLATYTTIWAMACCSWAGNANGPYPSLSAEFHNQARGQLGPIHLTIGGIALWQHTLDDVLQEFGPATVQPHGHARFVCYVSSDPTDRSAVVFETNDLGGLEGTVTSFVVTRTSEISDFASRCATSSSVHQGMTTASGIGLETTESDLESVLGAPTYRGEDKVYYHLVDQLPMSVAEQQQLGITWSTGQEHPYWDVSTTIETHFSDGELMSFVAHKVVTY